jgi:hypothetical protein
VVVIVGFLDFGRHGWWNGKVGQGRRAD